MNTGAGMRTSVQPRFAIARELTSDTGHAGDHGQGPRAVYGRLAELGGARVLAIEVQRVLVHREQR